MSHDVARALVALRTDPEVQARLQHLAENATEGTLSEADRAEYETLVRAIDFVAILQSKARSLLAGSIPG